MPGDTRPHVARKEKKKKARAAAEATGTLNDVRGVLWRNIERVEALTEDADKGTVLKAAHALTQSCAAYVKLLEVGEIEARLGELEARLAAGASGSAAGDGAATSRLPQLLPPLPPR